MSKESKQRRQEKSEERINNILLIPIALMLTLVPLIVRMKIIVPSEAVQSVFRKSQIVDFFAQEKAMMIILITGIMIVMLFFLFDKSKIKKDNYILFYSIGTGIFLLFSILSTIFSEYKYIALWGVPDRNEGMVVTLCYVLIMFYTLYGFNKPVHYKYILIPLGIVTGILTIIGLSQWIGKDLMIHTEIGRALIVPEKYAHLREALGTKIGSKTAYGTFSNPNYLGSFVALVFPIFFVSIFFVKDWIKQFLFTLLAFCNIFLVVASGSRAGMIGCALAVLMALFIFGRIAIKKWFITISTILAGVVILVGVNQASGGKFVLQIQRLMRDIEVIITPEDQLTIYKNKLHVREIRSEDGKVVIVMQNNALAITSLQGELGFYDQEEKPVEYEETEKVYSTKDDRFASLTFEKIFTSKENTRVAGVALCIDNKQVIPIKVDSIQGVYPIDSYTQKEIKIMDAPVIGFKGKERSGSGRGYIWSRSIPILIDSLIIGKGVDTFVMYFPQNDYISKFYALYDANIIVDKPHNMYLQIGINNGGVALIVYLILIIGYIAQSMGLYTWKSRYASIELTGIATFLGIMGYLVTGVFNDSVVGIAFISWILLGTGISINYLVSHQVTKEIET
ncbi:O-antigen ligase family protein [Cellulosilyticum sp. I15G10I2]|uniref:O-antigen ligase family protein n=1 Tax=Cellulosilyticum sp. I15G10I2 TaxID=1892843 RepID=UPI00085BAFE3|nr:O-antigen ligase family protein [Cellulosilyticum sp. I15G10I2]